MRTVTKLTFLFLFVCTVKAAAQPSVQKLKEDLILSNSTLIEDFKIDKTIQSQAAILLSRNASLPINNINSWLNTNLKLRANTDALIVKDNPVKLGIFEVQKFQQMYKGLKVEHGIINATAKNGNTTMLQMEFYPVENDFRISPTISMEAARGFAFQVIPAEVYAWQSAPNLVPIPEGELLIIADFTNNFKMTLAYKFEIYAVKPLDRAYVYINAENGKLILKDNIIKHGNANGVANTRYSGDQTIVTDFQAGAPAGSQYRLRQTRDGHDIRTLDYQYLDESPANTFAAKDFTDNDNNWTNAEFGDSAVSANLDDAALEAHFNMQIVNDYWKEIHQRNSWNNANGNIISYIHVTQNGNFMDNAYWNGNAMFFGDGDGANDPPQTSIDDCGHELGHAICQTTSALVYRWESGAINESFSDIWAACITNYLKKKYPTIPGNKNIWRLFEETSGPKNAIPGLRDMANPLLFGNPGTYKDTLWKAASFDVCPNPKGGAGGNDNCGVHTNSGVLNKWFYLITQGGNGTNFFHTPYNVVGMQFGKSDSIAYLTELNLTPNAGYKTTRNVSVNAAITLFGDNAEAQTVRNAWLAVAVDTAIFDMSNTSAFLSNSFSSVVVGKHGCIWAGTTTAADNASKGLYRFDGKKWDIANVLTNNAIQGMTTDKNGGIWIAQSGRSGAQAITGGINYFADSAFSTNIFYSVSNGAASRNSRSIFVDSSRLNAGNPMVWVSSLAQITAGISANGGISTGLNTASPNFTKITKGIDLTLDVGGTQTIGGNGTEVWAFASGNYGRSQILRYDAATKDSLVSYDSTNVTMLTKTFQAKSIYFDNNKNKWLGLQTNGLVVLDKLGVWHQIDTATFRTILPTGTIVNNNAITGDKLGNVYFGTTNGLVYYNRGPIDQLSSYRRFTTVHGLPSNNVRGIAVDTIRYKLIIATDNGIVFFDQQCMNATVDCWKQIPNNKSDATSISSGNWSNPSIWSNNKIPDENTIVNILHTILVDIDANCNSITVKGAGLITVNAGKKLNIADNLPTVNQTSSKNQ